MKIAFRVQGHSVFLPRPPTLLKIKTGYPLLAFLMAGHSVEIGGPASRFVEGLLEESNWNSPHLRTGAGCTHVKSQGLPRSLIFLPQTQDPAVMWEMLI